jgi:hypothetical protein
MILTPADMVLGVLLGMLAYCLIVFCLIKIGGWLGL